MGQTLQTTNYLVRAPQVHKGTRCPVNLLGKKRGNLKAKQLPSIPFGASIRSASDLSKQFQDGADPSLQQV